jgi:hypothetical protein
MLCDAPFHSFIVCSWDSDSISTEATDLICQHCLQMVRLSDVRIRNKKLFNQKELMDNL